MSVWTQYANRITGAPTQYDPQRNAKVDHTQMQMRRKLLNSLSYKKATLHGVSFDIAVQNIRDDMNEKKIYSMPGENLPHGDIIEWNGDHWLITEVDSNYGLCAYGKMRRCNYFVRWLDDTGKVIGRWCVIEDGTKYLIGEKSEDMMSIGDARIAMTIGKDADTNKLNRGRRFLIDDLDANSVLAYQITKPNKLFNVYNGRGVFRFILNEVPSTDNDNVEARIADYYSWHPKTEQIKPDTQTAATPEQIAKKATDDANAAPLTINESGVWL